MSKKDENAYAFIKLKRSENYKKWARKMKFALQEAELIRIIDDDKTRSITHIMKQKKTLLAKNDENRIERREEVLKK